MSRPLSARMVEELRELERFGEPTDPMEWSHANGLWWRNRERVLDALRSRGLIVSNASGSLDVTDAGRAALAKAGVS
jgi:hypothetical protein